MFFSNVFLKVILECEPAGNKCHLLPHDPTLMVVKRTRRARLDRVKVNSKLMGKLEGSYKRQEISFPWGRGSCFRGWGKLSVCVNAAIKLIKVRGFFWENFESFDGKKSTVRVEKSWLKWKSRCNNHNNTLQHWDYPTRCDHPSLRGFLHSLQYHTRGRRKCDWNQNCSISETLKLHLHVAQNQRNWHWNERLWK